MAETKRKSKTGAPRTEVFAMRLDPKLKYLAEIAARKQRRSLANFIEWTIERALENVYLLEPGARGSDDPGETVIGSSAKLWALDESDRLIQLAKNYPELLTYDEQLIWQVINEQSVYNEQINEVSVFVNGHTISNSLVRKCWPEIKAYALGTGTEEELDSVLCNHDNIRI